jgi:hypothetical protein
MSTRLRAPSDQFELTDEPTAVAAAAGEEGSRRRRPC